LVAVAAGGVAGTGVGLAAGVGVFAGVVGPGAAADAGAVTDGPDDAGDGVDAGTSVALLGAAGVVAVIVVSASVAGTRRPHIT
jgi:hypothetical protein